ncbi:hypothetical protein AB6F62_11175 [Providencia huaxiensis]|uniref:hypothetical protein n=1 Tax=Providencia huaxiensis TaxID=2027290 RepID=UPI0034DCCC6F
MVRTSNTDKASALNNEANAFNTKSVPKVKALANLKSFEGRKQERKLSSKLRQKNTKNYKFEHQNRASAESAGNYTKVIIEDAKKLNQFVETAPRRVEIDGEKWEKHAGTATMLTAQLKRR